MERHPSTNESNFDKMYRYFNEMDFAGQNSSKNLCIIVQVLSTIIGFIIGYVNNQFSHCVYFVLATSALLCLLTVPCWPFMFRRNELEWLPAEIPADLQLKKEQ